MGRLRNKNMEVFKPRAWHMAVSLKRKPFSWSAHFNPRPVVDPKMVLVPRKLPSTITSSLTDAIVYYHSENCFSTHEFSFKKQPFIPIICIISLF